ncbi:MAG: alaS [Gammaproteobacteria bacterium]|jgi:alanyl-tRNA synthetase|nr:alaS [Gammaproteobacteria bacterium]
MNSNELRQKFLEYFQENGHTLVASSSLIPHNDPTLLFVNAGMVQFKDAFLGLDKRPYTRACSSQTCVRAGGKHNDLDNVGYTARHHTFFEMLGNFSFGDYFKREAIYYAWNFLTKVLNLPAEKLWVTVFEEDREAADIWLNELKIDPKRFSRCGVDDNFWSMGDTGPCGPCSEIFYDHGEAIFGGPPGSADADGDRYVEVWNMVFMQYDRQASGELQPLPKPSVDTGMGLERISAVMQGVHNNYDTDLFVPLIQAIAEKARCKDFSHTSLRVIADHIRSCSFLVADGVIPSNEGRGYVLRRIIRRAVRHGHALGLNEPFFYSLVSTLASILGEAYPKMVLQQEQIARTLKQEEEQFSRTLEQGMRLLEQEIAKLSGQCIPGSIIFRLYDTYGFPPDLTADIARERGLHLDREGFEEEMAKQRELSSKASQFDFDYHEKLAFEDKTHFTGYELLADSAQIIGLVCEGKKVDVFKAGQKGAVILSHTPFYAESGGQVGDQGALLYNNEEFMVEDTQKQGSSILHLGYLKQGEWKTGLTVTAKVSHDLRRATARNHTATHLLHAVLQKLLGKEVVQKGSLVAPDRLRFDFSYSKSLTPEILQQIEERVNAEILNNTLVETHTMNAEEAIKGGAMALFGEKYDEVVRVLQIGDFSKELCGGTHVSRSGDIGLFKIISEAGVAAGIRRIEAITGMAAWQWVNTLSQDFNALCDVIKIQKDDAVMRAKQQVERWKKLEKNLEKTESQLALLKSRDLLSQVEKIASVNYLCSDVGQVDPKTLREMLNQMKAGLESSVIVLASVHEDKVHLVAGVSAPLSEKVHAGQLVGFLAEKLGGKGGGRADMAQAAGNDVSQLKVVLGLVREWVVSRMG